MLVATTEDPSQAQRLREEEVEVDEHQEVTSENIVIDEPNHVEILEEMAV